MNTLIIKNISPKLSYNERKELLVHFGAQSVTNKPNYSFATFCDEYKCSEALKRLHQLLVFGQRLRVEFAINQNNLNLLPIINEPHIKEKTNRDSVQEFKEEKLRQFLNQINYISPSLGLNYLPSPLLKYSYPTATLEIVNNIAHALLSHPTFYTQVLHLMNKMNIPPPFHHHNQTIVNFDFSHNQNITRNEESDDSESELESSENEDYPQISNFVHKPVKRVAKKLKSGFVGHKADNERHKFESKIKDKRSGENKVVSQEDVFEVPKVMAQKSRIEIKIKARNAQNSKDINS